MALNEFFYPKSIAVIGASNKPGKVGYTLVKKLEKFNGKKYFINIEGYKIGNIKTFKKLSDINEKIDLLIIATPAVLVKQAVLDAANKKIKKIIIISAGFSETGRKDLENEIYKIAQNKKIRILGPNNFGVVNTKNNLDCTFSKLTPKRGTTAFASQSGALWSSMVDYSLKNGIGFSKFISLGDMLDVSFNEVIEYLNKDKKTNSILLYIETIKDGKRFMKAVKRSKKSIIVIKSGKTKEGAEAVHSHTGSLAGSYEIYKAACLQSGAKFIESINESIDLLNFIQKYKKPKSKKTIIITNAGGPGVMLTDILIKNEAEIVKIPHSIKFTLPISASLKNPIDILGDAKYDRFREVFNKLKKEKFYDIAIIIITPQDMTDGMKISFEIEKFKKESKKTVIVCMLGPESLKECIEYLKNKNIIVFDNIENAGNLIKNL